MNPTASPETTVVLASFIKRLETVEEIVRIVMSQAPLSALFTFRGEPEKRVLMDFSKRPARVLFDEDAKGGQIFVTIDGEVMHEVFLDRIKPGKALGRRELLLRGCAMDFARVIPLFDFSPILYREHLADIGYGGRVRPGARALTREELMSEQVFKGEPIPVVQLSWIERAAVRLVEGAAYGLGYLVGFLRYRVLKKMSLFGVLSAMSRGLAAATPAEEREGGDAGR